MRGPLILLCAAAVLLVGPGCDDPVDLCDPLFPAGGVQGRVRSAGLSLEGYVTARNIELDYPNSSEFRVEPDETGFYSLDLPSGRYVFQLIVSGGRYDYAASGPGFGQVPPDTILVGAGISTPEINFDLGGVTLGFDLPAYLHGQYGQVILHPRDFGELDIWRLVTEGSAEIVAGRIDVEVAGVLPGEYQIEVVLGCPSSNCYSSGGGERFWMPGTRNPAESPWYTVGPDSVLSLSGAMLGEPARLEGRISGAWLDMGIQQEPVLSIVTEDSLMTLNRIRVDRDGGFAIDIHMPEPVKLLVFQSGVDYWIGGPRFEDATVFNLEPGITITGIEHDQCGVHLVVDETGLPLNGGNVLIYDRTDLSLVADLYRGGNSERHVPIPNLWPGEFLIQISQEPWERGASDWKPQWFDRAATIDLAQPVLLVAAGQVARLNLVMELGGRISGRVMDEDGPIFFYEIGVYPVGEDAPWADKMVWMDSFNLTGLPDGDYNVGARFGFIDPPTEETLWYPGTVDRQAAQIIEIRDGTVVENLDIIIPQ